MQMPSWQLLLTSPTLEVEKHLNDAGIIRLLSDNYLWRHG